MQNPGKRKLSLLAVLFVVAVMLFGFREKEADAAEKRLSSVTAVYKGDTVLVGHSIDLSKLTVMGLYTDGSYVKVKDYSLSTYVVTKAGSNQITLTSDGVSTSFSVNGKKILFLTASYSKSSVTVGEELKRDEITVYAYYSDGTNEKVTDYILSHTLVSLVGTNQFTIIYEGETVTLSITGKEEKKPKTLYAAYYGPAVIVGNAPKRDDFYVTVLFNDNTIERVTTFELTPSVIKKEGTNVVSVSYGELAEEVKIQGLAKDVVSITAEYKGLPIVIGKTVAMEDIKVTATFNDGSKDTVTNFTLSSSVVYSVGDNLITVFCGGAVAYINVRGVEAEIIDYDNSAEQLVRSGNRYSRVTIAVNSKADPEKVSIDNVDAELVRKAMRRIVKSDKYIAFEVSFDDPEMDVFLPMTMKVTVPTGYDRENFAVFYTPNRKTIMAKMNGEFLKDGSYEFKMFQPGTYIIADCTELVYIEALELEETELTLRVGRSASLDPVIYPHTATNQTLRYTSSRPQVVTVSEEGLLEALQPGASVIRVEAQDGSGKSCKLIVYVKE